jgi:transcriptional regulator with XRE-family HTH domain
MDKFREIIKQHLKEKQKSMRQFASEIGATHATISLWLKEDSRPKPDTQLMINIAQVIGLDLMTVVTAAYPDATGIDIDTMVIAGKIKQLPPDKRRFVEDLVAGMLLNSDNKSE